MDEDPGAQAKAFISILSFFVPTLDDPPAAGSLYCQAKSDIEEMVERVATTGGKGLPCCEPEKQAFREELAETEIGWAVLKGIGDMARGLDNAQGMYTEVILDDFEQYVAENNLGAAWLLTEVAQRANASQEILESMAETVAESEMVGSFKEALSERIERARAFESEFLARMDADEEDPEEMNIEEFEGELEDLIETWEAEDRARAEPPPASTADILSKLSDPRYLENLRRMAQLGGLADIQPGDLDDDMDDEDRDEYLAAHPWLLRDLNYPMFAAEEFFDAVEAEVADDPDRPEDEGQALDNARARIVAWSPMEANDALKGVAERDSSVKRAKEVTAFFASLKTGSVAGMETAARHLSREGGVEPEPKHALPHELRAISATRSDKPDLALEEAREAVRIAPEDPKAHAVLAVAHTARKEVQEALAAADEAVALNESSPFAHIARALALRLAQRYDESNDEVDRAMELHLRGGA
jgi:tetratricopeptide (TPR) repeat protein